MYSLEELNAKAYALRLLVERKEQIQQAILTRLAQVEVELKRLDEPPEFDRYERSIEKLDARLKTVEAEVTDLQGQDCQTRRDLYDLTTKVDRFPRR